MTTQMNKPKDLQAHFDKFRQNIIGIGHTFESPYGTQKIVYADWIASGRMYAPLEDELIRNVYPYVANTHTETTYTGKMMTNAYNDAKLKIKQHVNASSSDILISSNSGMTGVVNKLQRIIGLKVHERFQDQIKLAEEDLPVIFVTHMEHHSNQTSWIETTGDVVVISACLEGKVDLENFKGLLDKYKNRKTKIAAVTSCSNVTGLYTPYHDIAKMIHQAGGLCFVDFACSAPYIDIDMHPSDPESYLDAIYFSPHKFLGGPSSSGILIFNHKLYNNRVPDNPGGGTVDWTNPWGEHKYHDEIEAREDGGTPAFLQTIRVAMAIDIKDQMGTENMQMREHQLLEQVWPRLDKLENLHVLANDNRDRLGIISFYVSDVHYNLAVQLLNDKYGIQVRGGCSCAGTYGHYLLEVTYEYSKQLTDQISSGIFDNKPGWVRLSLHPTMTDEELDYILTAIENLCHNHKEWAQDYTYNKKTNEWDFKGSKVNIH